MEPSTDSRALHSASVIMDLLPHSTAPLKERLRARLVELLNSKGEVLPAAESPLGKLWKLVSSPSSSLAECEEIILLDPALTSRIFRVANSAAYHANATTVSEAIRFVGFRCIREFVFNAGVFAEFSDVRVPDGWDLFWLRNIFVARMTERIVALNLPTNGTDYLAGLLHDLGWLFLATYAPEEFDQIWNYKGRISDAEHQILPFSHANLGAAIAAKSLLPSRVSDAILYHHRQGLLRVPTESIPLQSPLFLSLVISTADRLADASHLDLFTRSTETMAQVLSSPEVMWLAKSGKGFDPAATTAEELEKAQELFTAFFTSSPS